jgi:hypothetical protein
MIRRIVLIAALLLGAVSCSDDTPIVSTPLPSGPTGVWTNMNDVPVVSAHYAVSTAADGTIVAVGSGGSIVVYDGTEWSRKEHRNSEGLSRVWAGAKDDIYMTDGNRLYRHNGTDCEQVELDQNPQIQAVWGTSATDVYAAGRHGCVVHFDGTQWTDISLGDDISIKGIWGTAPDHLYAIGSEGSLYQYNGQGWTAVQYESQPSDECPTLVDGASAANILISGAKTYFYDGTGWREIAPVEPGDTREVRDICVVGENDYYAVNGESLLHFDGAAWSELPLERYEQGTGASSRWVAKGIFGAVKTARRNSST